MDELSGLLREIMNEKLVQAILSNSRDKSYGDKLKMRPVLLQGKLMFQSTRYAGNQVFHENHDAPGACGLIEKLLQGQFRQCEIITQDKSATVLVSKKGKMTIKARAAACNAPRELSHNREKQYILREGCPVDFLVGLGVQTPDGRITKNKYDKFRQINRYLEFIEDILDQLPREGTIHVIDFGCGKSYLTFAMYYYLRVLQGRDIHITGLDLKADVIRRCNELAAQCGYKQLRFQVGDISAYEGEQKVDMVVSLHACDTATDYALEKAVGWGGQGDPGGALLSARSQQTDSLQRVGAVTALWSDQGAHVSFDHRCNPGRIAGAAGVRYANPGVYRYGAYTQKSSYQSGEETRWNRYGTAAYAEKAGNPWGIREAGGQRKRLAGSIHFAAHYGTVGGESHVGTSAG